MPITAASASRGYADALLTQLAADRLRIALIRRGSEVSAGTLLDMIGTAAVRIEAATDFTLPSRAGHRRIGVMLPDNTDAIICAIGGWLARAEIHFLDHRSPASEIERLRANRGLDLVVVRNRPSLRDAPGILDLPRLDAPDPRDPLLAAARARIAQALAAPPGPDDPGIASTSSGVSGPPKIEVSTQGDMLLRARRNATNQQRGGWGAALSATSVAFGAARVVWWRNLLAGKLIFSLDLLHSVAELDAALRDPRIEECTLPPVSIRRLVTHHLARGDLPAPRYPHLLKLQSVGGPATAADKLAAHHCLTHNYLMTYSSSETGVISTIGGEDLLAHPESCGKPLPGIEVSMLDADGNPLPPDAVGRIAVRNPSLSSSAAPQFPGDLGWRDAEGFIHVVARGDGIICRKGENFWAGTIEDRLKQDPGLLDAAVLVMEGKEGDDGILLALHAVEGTDRTALVQRLKTALPAMQHPDEIVFIGSADINPAGKIRRADVLNACLARRRAADG